MGSSKRQYAELAQIYDELEQATAVQRRLGCPVIEVVGAFDRGDRAPHHSPGEPAARGGRGLLSTAPKEPVPLWRWGTWIIALGIGITLFYVLLTPIWLGLRLAGWLADRGRAA